MYELVKKRYIKILDELKRDLSLSYITVESYDKAVNSVGILKSVIEEAYTANNKEIKVE